MLPFLLISCLLVPSTVLSLDIAAFRCLQWLALAMWPAPAQGSSLLLCSQRLQYLPCAAHVVRCKSHRSRLCCTVCEPHSSTGRAWQGRHPCLGPVSHGMMPHTLADAVVNVSFIIHARYAVAVYSGNSPYFLFIFLFFRLQVRCSRQ